MMSPEEFFWKNLTLFAKSRNMGADLNMLTSKAITETDVRNLPFLMLRSFGIEKEGDSLETEYHGSKISLTCEYLLPEHKTKIWLPDSGAETMIVKHSLVCSSANYQARSVIMRSPNLTTLNSMWLVMHDDYQDHGELVLLRMA